VLIGEAAHIAGEHGGRDGGRPSARFDKDMSPEERNSLSNLIYVCPNCHRKIDAYPQGEIEYPTSKLRSIKEEHERRVASAMEDAVASVTFKELEEATKWVHTVPPPPPDFDFGRIFIGKKIDKNGLSVQSRNLIISHLTATPQVRAFIQSLSQDDPQFSRRLTSGFLEYYHKLRNKGMSSGDDIFVSMCLFVRRGFEDIRVQYAAEVVLVYLFETCDVFER